MHCMTCTAILSRVTPFKAGCLQWTWKGITLLRISDSLLEDTIFTSEPDLP